MPTELLSAQQAADRLGISLRRVQRLLRAGEIRAQKMPGDTGAYIITPSALAAYERKVEKAAS